MTDVRFHELPVLTDSAMDRNTIVFLNSIDYKKIEWTMLDGLTDDERTARRVADRLLDRGGALTLDMLQRAYDAVAEHHAAPTHIIMSPETRRDYVKLFHADDRRYP